MVRARTRTWLVEQVEPRRDGGGYTVVHLACVDDDAQGQTLDVIWEHELDARILNEEAWSSIGERGFDDARPFSAFLHTLRWNCVTATDPRLFQSPFRAGIRIDAYQLEPLRKALRLPRVNLFIADDVGLGKTIEAGLIATELLLRRRVREIVVAAPPSMLLQWQEELESRFGLVFEILDRDYIERVAPRARLRRQSVGRRSRASSSRTNCSSTRPTPARCATGSTTSAPARCSSSTRRTTPRLRAARATRSTRRFTRAVRDLAARFEHRLFLSATPHNGHSNSFARCSKSSTRSDSCAGVKVAQEQPRRRDGAPAEGRPARRARRRIPEAQSRAGGHSRACPPTRRNCASRPPARRIPRDAPAPTSPVPRSASRPKRCSSSHTSSSGSFPRSKPSRARSPSIAARWSACGRKSAATAKPTATAQLDELRRGRRTRRALRGRAAAASRARGRSRNRRIHRRCRPRGHREASASCSTKSTSVADAARGQPDARDAPSHRVDS